VSQPPIGGYTHVSGSVIDLHLDAMSNPVAIFDPKHQPQHLVMKLVTGNAGEGADSNKEYEASDKRRARGILGMFSAARETTT